MVPQSGQNPQVGMVELDGIWKGSRISQMNTNHFLTGLQDERDGGLINPVYPVMS
jgi:hypothetical protein